MINQFKTIIYPTVNKAIQNKQAVVALEFAVITHGLPKPTNIELAQQMEAIIQKAGGIPATMAFINWDPENWYFRRRIKYTRYNGEYTQNQPS